MATIILTLATILIIVIMKDRTQERSNLRKVNQQLQDMVASLPTPLCLIDPQERIMAMNKSCADTLHVRIEESLRVPWDHIITSELSSELQDVLRRGLAASKQGEATTTFATLHNPHDDEPLTVTVQCKPITWGIPNLTLVTFLDHTRRQIEEAGFIQGEKMQAIGQLAGGIAHDFNNQLMAILGYAELLLEDADSSQRQFLSYIKHAAENSQSLTRQLLAFSRKGTFKEELIEVRSDIEKMITLLGRSIDKNISIVRDYPPYPVHILGDPVLIQNALLNLALNSRDAMPMGGTLTFHILKTTIPSEGLTWVQGVLPAGQYIAIEVRDTGGGIPESIREHIFEPFFTTKPKGEGTGMGLSAVLGTVERHQGAITLDSAPGKGTVFTIYLPEHHQQPVSGFATEDMPTPSVPDHTLRTANIIVCDDELVIRMLLQSILVRAGHTVTLCRDGLDALRVINEGKEIFDLIIIDMIMPIMSGEETFRKVRQLRPEIKGIIISGFSALERAESLIDLGIDAYLPKPVYPSDLLNCIDMILSSPE